MTSPDSEPICLSCGLCCDGTLFVRTQLVGEEIVRLGRRGAMLSSSMAQPCAYHRDGKCGIYDERPQVCRSFRCTLLERYENDDVDRDECLGLIAAAKAAQAAVLEVLAPPMSLHDLRHVAAADDAASQAWRAAHGEILLRLLALSDHLERYFQATPAD